MLRHLNIFFNKISLCVYYFMAICKWMNLIELVQVMQNVVVWFQAQYLKGAEAVRTKSITKFRPRWVSMLLAKELR